MRLELKWQVLIIVCIGIFMSTLDGSILNIANPTIARELNVSMAEIQWIVTAYMLVITASLLFWGRLGDKAGSTKIFTGGFMIFTIGSFLCSSALVLSFLIAARIIQALGASMMMATGIGIVSNIFPAGERGKALGLTGSIVGVGNMTGPVVGGFLVAHYSWNIIFLLNVPVGLAGFFLALKYLPPQMVQQDQPGHDAIGTVLFALFAILLILSLVGTQSISPLLLLTALAALAVFWWFEKRTVNPMLDFSLFKIQKFVLGNLMALAAYTPQTFVFFLLPFFLERMLGLSPTYSGCLMTIPPAIMIGCAPLAGYLSDRLGSDRLTTAAFTLMAAAYFLLSTLNSTSGTGQAAIGLFLMGMGMAMFGSPNNSSILGSVPPEKAGYTGGFISTVRNLAFALGTAAAVSIFTLLLTRRMETLSYIPAYISATSTVYKIGALVACIGLILSLLNRKPYRMKIDNPY